MELLNALLSLFGIGSQPEEKKKEDTSIFEQYLPLLAMLGPQMSMSNMTPQGTGILGQSTHPQWGETINRLATQEGVNPRYVEAVMMAESMGNPRALSSAGAQGLMQLMPSTAASLGVKNSNDPEQNLLGGIKYIKQLASLPNIGDDPEKVAAAYNWGPHRKVFQPGVSWASIEQHAPSETRNYVPKVRGGLLKGSQ